VNEPAPADSRAADGAAARAVGGVARLCAFGDAVLDVVVALERATVVDDDVPARITLSAGGQAANVAAWAVALGVPAAVVSRVGADASGRLLRDLLVLQGVELLAPGDGARTGAVTSIVTPDGRRTMASDRGATESFPVGDLDPGWFRGRDWLHVSGYALFGAGSSDAALRAAVLARSAGARVSVDLSSVTVVELAGRAEIRRLVAAAAASVVFANAAEHAAAGPLDVATLVVKHGPAGCEVHEAGAVRAHPAPEAVVLDTTGAGDAFAAGWLVGGPPLALAAARSCVGLRGAMPPPGRTP